MKNPKTLKSAIANNYLIKRISYAGSTKCLVCLQPRFYNADMSALISFWINTRYVKRNYPNSFSRANY